MEFFVRNSAHALVPQSDGAPSHPGLYACFKRPLDVMLALVGLALGAPVIAVAALFVKLSSQGPVFYSQMRLGLGGRPFRIHKLRSMYVNSEALTGPCWSAKADTRVTPIGRLLRWSHIDELPQMLNILVGDMSLIGPRPERPEMVPGLEKAIPRYRERLVVRPGLTGLAQVQLPPDTDLNSVRVKLAHDLCYLERLSLGLDFRILIATAFHVLGLPAGRTRQLLVLPGVKVAPASNEHAARQPVVVPNLQAV
jgi:lipopolysaccharide/colanic/teichoic acid biosynthesis glycosyltransferase